MSNYTHEEAAQIGRCFAILRDDVARLHPSFGQELERARDLIAREVRDPVFGTVLTVGEALRGINKDQREPVTSQNFLLTEALRASLHVAFSVGLAIAPFALRNEQGFLRRWFGRSSPRLSQAAKEAMLRCAAAHASSRNRGRTLQLAPPAGSRRQVVRRP